MAQRYFFDKHVGREFLIPAEKRAEWDEFTENCCEDPDDARSCDLPVWAELVENTRWYTFEKPEEVDPYEEE